ncbi:hypothetical protein SOVF_147770 [Spinacia oleracea]|nr:hypothetical protein SOVF_147770 [Spinacia oleracea]
MLEFVGGGYKTFEVDTDEMCWWYLVELVEKCGKVLKEVDHVYYMEPRATTYEKGLKRVFTDADCRVLMEYSKDMRCIYCYVVPSVEVPRFLQLLVVAVQPTPPPEAVKKLTPRRALPKSTNIKAPPSTTQLSQSNTQNPKTTASSPPPRKLFHSPYPIVQDVYSSSGATHLDEFFAFNTFVDYIAFNYDEEGEELNLVDTEQQQQEDHALEPDNKYDADEEYYVHDCTDDDIDDELEDSGEIHTDALVYEEIEEVLVEDVIHSDGDTDDDEFKDAQKSLRSWNADALKIARQLQNDVDDGKLLGQDAHPQAQPQQQGLYVVVYVVSFQVF